MYNVLCMCPASIKMTKKCPFINFSIHEDMVLLKIKTTDSKIFAKTQYDN